MKLSTLLDRIQMSVDAHDGDHSRTVKYLRRLRNAAEYEETLSLDVKASMSKAAKKAIAAAPKEPVTSESPGAEVSDPSAQKFSAPKSKE